jgi:hypothetical protein
VGYSQTIGTFPTDAKYNCKLSGEAEKRAWEVVPIKVVFLYSGFLIVSESSLEY